MANGKDVTQRDIDMKADCLGYLSRGLPIDKALLSTKYGLSLSRVTQLILAFNVQPKLDTTSTEILQAQIIKLYLTGNWTQTAIAKELNSSLSTVNKYIHRFNRGTDDTESPTYKGLHPLLWALAPPCPNRL